MKTVIRTKRNLILATLLAAPFIWAPLAQADSSDMESGGEGSGMEEQEAPDIDVSDSEIEAFANAMTDVQELGQEWTEKMQETDDQEELSSMQEEAQEEMISAIEEHDMSVEEYNEIATAAQQDPELAQKIEEAAQ